jgi:hypothetical protein
MQASSTGSKVNVRGILLSLAMNAALPVALYLLSKRSLSFPDLVALSFAAVAPAIGSKISRVMPHASQMRGSASQ